MDQYERPQPAEPVGGFERRHHSSVEGVVTLLDWLLIAFILALVFLTFGIQAFQIPTGSMAETLRGDHYRMRCVRCGYPFDTGSDSLSLDPPQCPNCGRLQPAGTIGPLVNGDRIFVLKCIYQFFKPRRWDVVVFKNPLNPKDNYIKRLIGLPGEVVQIIDGDIYIDGDISRKPYNVQRELWMPIYLQRYQPPLDASESSHAEPEAPVPWRQPFVNEEGSSWEFDPDRPSCFMLGQAEDRLHTLVFDSGNPNAFRVTYGYNDSGSFSVMPICSDLMIRFQVRADEPGGVVGAELEKYGVRYAARIDLDGALGFYKFQDGQWNELRRILTDNIRPDGFESFEFANVDHRLVLRWGDKRFSYELSEDKDMESVTKQAASPRVAILGSGHLELRDVSLYRDLYYMDSGIRATDAKPFVLGADEFFMCGDNSPNSLDSRLWSQEGVGNDGTHYREGIVPRDYLMGKAVLVYWSQAFRPAPRMVPLIPNFDAIKVISGSSEQDY